MRKVAFLTALMFVFIGSAVAFAGAPQNVVDLANNKLVELGKDAVAVKAVNEANAEGKTMAQIEEMDAKWKADKKAGNKPAYMTALMENECAQQLNKLMGEHAFITEIFVTDNQGANVCQTGGTGDYWQGDEAKFQKVFNKGVLVADPEEEDGKMISQVSVPVVDGEKHVGTMTIGVDVNKVP
jgi:hypothetical protein